MSVDAAEPRGIRASARSAIAHAKSVGRLQKELATLELQQRYQRFDGRITADGAATGTRVEQGVVNGERIRFVADLGEGRRAFEGRVAGDRIEPLQPGSADGRWQAVRAQ